MRILGLDPGSVRMGYGVIDVEGVRLRYVECGVLEAAGREGVYRRLRTLGIELQRLLRQMRPDEAALEAGFIKGQQGALVSGAARGVAGFCCELVYVPVVEYAPKTVKKAAAGHGGADKDSVARMVMLQLGLHVKPPLDATDALAIAICHARRPTVMIER